MVGVSCLFESRAEAETYSRGQAIVGFAEVSEKTYTDKGLMWKTRPRPAEHGGSYIQFSRKENVR